MMSKDIKIQRGDVMITFRPEQINVLELYLAGTGVISFDAEQFGDFCIAMIMLQDEVDKQG